MVQAPQLDGPSLCLFTLQQDGLAASEVDVGRRQIAQALVVAPVIVMADEVADVRFEVARQEVVFEQGPVLERLMPAFDFALGLRMVRRSARVSDSLLFELFGQIVGDVARAVVRKQPRTVNDLGAIEPGGRQRHAERLGHVAGLHRGA